MSVENPTIYGTQKDYAYDAFSRGYCGKLTFDDATMRAQFEVWWNALPAPIADEHELFKLAWIEGAALSFNAWYMEILKAQPVTR